MDEGLRRKMLAAGAVQILVHEVAPFEPPVFIVNNPCHGKRNKKGKAKKDWSATYRTWCAKPYCPIHEKSNGLAEKSEDWPDGPTTGKGWTQ